MENKIEVHPLPIGTMIYSFSGDGKILSSILAYNNIWLYTVANEFCEFTVYSDDVFLVKQACIDAKKMQKDMVNHPTHYGGKEDPMEAIKIIEHYKLGFALGNCIKYILRSDKKGNKLEDLKKAAWYLNREIIKLENV